MAAASATRHAEFVSKYGNVAVQALIATPPSSGTTTEHSAIVDSKLFHASSTAYNGDFVASQRITTAVNMAGSEVVGLPRAGLVTSGVALHEFDVDDSTAWTGTHDSAAFLSQAAVAIEAGMNQDGAVLVNCAMGVSRSSFAVLWWILAYDRTDWGFLDAL